LIKRPDNYIILSQQTSQKIDQLQVTSDTLTSRGGLAFFVKYVQAIGIPGLLLNRFETFVADPAFAHTRIGQSLVELADKYGFDLQWHCGFRLAVRDVPDDFRGPAMPKIAERIAGRDGTLDAAVIGTAAASLHHDPQQWSEWGGYFDVLRLFRQLWHVLVHFGNRI
jgi:hypothetical protein